MLAAIGSDPDPDPDPDPYPDPYPDPGICPPISVVEASVVGMQSSQMVSADDDAVCIETSGPSVVAVVVAPNICVDGSVIAGCAVWDAASDPIVLGNQQLFH